MDDEKLEIQLNEVWRACRKVQTAIFRYGINICKDFCPHDPNGYGLISASIFSGIIGTYKNTIGLSDFECRELCDYFSLRDGRVNYKQFCKSVCNETHSKGEKKDFATGLEWNDPMHVNVIARPEDKRRLCILLFKIARIMNIPLMPYFQDYELVSENVGVVTVAHFSRVLHFMKIPLSDVDFLLICKRYMKDSYLINYVAFCKHLATINDYLKENKLLDIAGDIIKDFDGRLIDLELPQLPIINGVNVQTNIFKDSCNHIKDDKTICGVIFCLQKLILQRRIRLREFLEGFDHLRTGSITKNQFLRCLHTMGVGHVVTQRDFQMLCERYVDPIDTNRILWKIFEDEIDQVFTVKNLEKTPQLIVESPPQHIQDMPRPGSKDWDEVDETLRNAGEEALAKIQIRIKNRRLYLHPFFRNYDRLKSGHVGCQQANRIFIISGLLLTPNELHALHERYGNELGFNYSKFLEDVDPAEYAIPKLKSINSTLECPTYKEQDSEKPNRLTEEYFTKLLSNIKRQAVTKGVSIIDFMQDFDRHREGEILELDFVRALDNANVKLDREDVEAICQMFQSPRRGCAVLYREFCNTIDKVFIQIESKTGDNEVTAIPLLHLANLDCVDCFLNFDERTQCSHGLMKLARKPDEISNLSAAFKDFDRENCGTVRQNQFLRALTLRSMHYMISPREYDAICKCFGVMRGLHLEFNYREFLNILNVVHLTGQHKRNY